MGGHRDGLDAQGRPPSGQLGRLRRARASPSPHVEHCAGFIRHPARIPRRIPHDVDLDLADARHAGDRVLHHDRQLLRGGTVGRGERHVDGHRAVVGDIDLVD